MTAVILTCAPFAFGLIAWLKGSKAPEPEKKETWT